MQATISVVIGFLLMGVWLTFLHEGREEMRRTERVSYDFLFKWNVLPLLIALELFTTHQLAVLGIGVLAFFLCWPIAKLALMVLPLITGWHVGIEWFSRLYAHQDARVLLGAVLGAGLLTLASQAIVACMRRPPAHT